jgi:hypothetical protein
MKLPRSFSLLLVMACVSDDPPISAMGKPLADGGDAMRDTGAVVVADAGTNCALKNLLTNGDMENGAISWQGGTKDSFAHSGKQSLRWCAVSNYETITQTIAQKTAAAGVHARAWVRTAPDAGQVRAIFLGLSAPPQGDNIPLSNGNVGADWTCIEGAVSGPVTLDAFQAQMENALAPDAPSCALVDDVELIETPAGGVIPPECQCP